MGIDAYIRTETRFSIIGSVAVTMLFYSLVYGIGGSVPVWGVGGYAFDFGPQSFMTALICTWLPGLITRKRLQSGHALLHRVRLGDSSVLMTGLGAGLATLLVGGGVAVALLVASGATAIDWTLGLAIKCAFAAMVAMIVTPVGLRRLLVGN